MAAVMRDRDELRASAFDNGGVQSLCRLCGYSKCNLCSLEMMAAAVELPLHRERARTLQYGLEKPFRCWSWE